MLVLGSQCRLISRSRCRRNPYLKSEILSREEKEIRRLVKEGADPNYPDCDMLGFRYVRDSTLARMFS